MNFATTLARACDSKTTELRVADAFTRDSGFLVQVDQELIAVTRRGNKATQTALDAASRISWDVVRGVSGTTPAAHDIDAPVTLVSPGGIPVGDGVAVPVFIGNGDPTEDADTEDLVIPGAVWVDTTYGPPYAQKQWYPDVEDVPAHWQSLTYAGYYADGTIGAELSVNTDPDGPGVNVSVFDSDGNPTGIWQLSANLLVAGFGDLDTTGIGLILSATGIKTVNLPTADPHSVGALWSNSGVVTVSAGA